MSTTTDIRAEWDAWRADRADQLREPQGWLSLTALEWLDDTARSFPDLRGTWQVVGQGVVVDGVVGAPHRVEPVDGQPGVLVDVDRGRKVEVVRRTDSYALRVRDPEAPTRTAFRGVPVFDDDDYAAAADQRWIVYARFQPYSAPRRITVGAVVDGLQHFPTAVGTIRFPLGGAEHELVALAGGGKDGGLSLHFRDATSGRSTYGSGRILRVDDPDDRGRVRIDFNRTQNLPCAFTAFATCPLPPEENRLTVAVEAGERAPA